MLTIGEFSRICSVTTKTLRYYDEIGLLKPAIINHSNGYRYYDGSQLDTMLLISKLKQYTCSLEQVQEVLDDKSGDKLLLLLKNKHSLLGNKITEFIYLQSKLAHDIENMERGIDIMSYLDEIKVELVERPVTNILSSRQKMSIEEFGKYFGLLFTTTLKCKYTICGAPLAIYHDKEFDPANNDTETAFPVREEGENTRLLPGGLHTKTLHKGPYSELPSVYARVNKWVQANGYKITSAPFEAYLNDPCSGIPPEEYLTEVYFPISK